jgi:hypothetical protein
MSRTIRMKGTLRKVYCGDFKTVEETKEKIWQLAGETAPYSKYAWDDNDYWERYITTDNGVFEILSKEEFDVENSYCDLTYNLDGTISFHTRYHNGGTCMSEMLEDALEQK